MTVKQAEAIRNNFGRNSNHTEDEFFAFTEAMGFLIETVKSPKDMMYLGATYYELKDFGLALKYYEMAAAYDYPAALVGLGYLWYYGRTGEKNYEKAFNYFTRAAEKGDIQSAYKVADMYRNGYYVKQDYDKYKQIIRELYPKVRDASSLWAPLPEIYTRLAKIDSEEGRVQEAVELYDSAKDFLAQRLRCSGFFGDLNIMKWMIDDLYALTEFDDDNFDFYDLYYLLKSPCTVTFRFGNRHYSVKAVEENGECVISFSGKWYRTRDDFFGRAMIGKDRLTAICDSFYLFEVKR